MRFLGIDYGKKKVGLSVSDGNFASPFKVLTISSIQDAVVQVSQIIKKEAIEEVVIGIPESGEALKVTRSFVDELKKVPPPGWNLIEVDEVLSSYEATTKMVQMGTSKKARKEDDAYAASIILQNYLDSKK